MKRNVLFGVLAAAATYGLIGCTCPPCPCPPASKSATVTDPAARAEMRHDLMKGWVARPLVNGKVSEEVIRDFLKCEVEDRRDLVQEIARSGLGEKVYQDWMAVILVRDPDGNVRALTASQLGYEGTGLSDNACAALVATLKDSEPWTRDMACQSLMQREEKGTVKEVAVLLTDKQELVRITAVRAVGHLGGPEYIPTIVKMFGEKHTAEDACWYADALCRLGEDDVWVAAVQESAASDNWNVRRSAYDAMKLTKSKKVVRVGMGFLVGELRRASREGPTQDANLQAYVELCQLLDKRTDQRFFIDTQGRLAWWKEHAKEYGGEPIKVDEDEISAMQKALPKKMN